MITLSGYPVRAMTLNMPSVGRWVARLEVNSGAELLANLPESVTLDDGELSLVGHVSSYRVGSETMYVAAGPQALRNTVAAKTFAQSTVKQVVADTISDLGSLSVLSDRDSLKERISWTRVRGTALEAVAKISERQTLTWRILDSGELWLGPAGYTDTEDFAATVIDTDGASGNVLVAPSDTRLRPGTRWRGYEIDRVEHSFTTNEPLRTTIWVR